MLWPKTFKYQSYSKRRVGSNICIWSTLAGEGRTEPHTFKLSHETSMFGKQNNCKKLTWPKFAWLCDRNSSKRTKNQKIPSCCRTTSTWMIIISLGVLFYDSDIIQSEILLYGISQSHKKTDGDHQAGIKLAQLSSDENPPVTFQWLFNDGILMSWFMD